MRSAMIKLSKLLNKYRTRKLKDNERHYTLKLTLKLKLYTFRKIFSTNIHVHVHVVKCNYGLCTVAHKCTPNLNHSHYIQITRAEFKSPTPKIKSSHRIQKHSHQIQITHTKNQIFTPNSKTLTPNLNRSHRKSNLHNEFKSLTPN